MVRPRLGIREELDDTLPKGGPLQMAPHHGPDNLRQSQVGLLDCRGDRWVGTSGGELRVRGGQIGDTALPSAPHGYLLPSKILWSADGHSLGERSRRHAQGPWHLTSSHQRAGCMGRPRVVTQPTLTRSPDTA